VAALAACCAWFGGPVRLIMFGAGILLYELITNEDAKGPGTPLVLVVLVVAFAFMAVPLAFAAATVAKSLALFGAFGVLCLSCFTRPQSWLARAASWTPMRWLGNMSYSFYLLHGLALKGALLVATPFLPVSAQGPGFFAALLLPAFAIAVLASAVLFLVVERPLSLRPGRGSRPKTGGATEAIAGVVPDAPDIRSMSGRALPDRAAD
jgi:peptidoglycan/LPS O-acetylase OafA/YrhL